MTARTAGLYGALDREGLTQRAISDKAGSLARRIPQVERDRRPIGQPSTRKLGKALDFHYRVFL